MAAIISGLASLSEYATFLYKGASVLDSVSTVYRESSAAESNKLKTAINVGFIFAQLGEVFAFYTNASKGVQLGLRVTAGAADVARVVEERGVGWDSAAALFLRVGDGLNGALTHNCESLCTNKEMVEDAIQVLGTTAMVVTQRSSIGNRMEAIYTGFLRLIRWKRERGEAVPEPTDEDAVEWLANQARQIREFVESYPDITEVPSALFDEDRTLQKIVCPITGKLILRNPCTPAQQRRSETRIYYEYAALSEHVRVHGEGVPPPKWPEYLPFSLSAVRISEDIEMLVQGRLKDIHERVKRSLEQGRFD